MVEMGADNRYDYPPRETADGWEQPDGGPRSTANSRDAWLKTAFLCGSPVSYGLISDAMPAATRQLLVAANGHASGLGGSTPLYTAGDAGIEALMTDMLPMLEQNEVTRELLRRTFGDCRTRKEHPVARYCAALAEAVGVECLQAERPDDQDGSDGEAYGRQRSELGQTLSRALAALQAYLDSEDNDRINVRRRGLPPVGSEYYEVSFGACRVRSETAGVYTLDIFSAGEFRVYLLDAAGIFPLWVQQTPRISAERDRMDGRRLILRHPEPFGLLLLSDTVASAFRTEASGREADPVRERMRFEERILRIVTAASDEEELGAQAGRLLADLASGQESVSGAVTVLGNGRTSYARLRDACRTRLQRLEQDMALIPEGYDPAGSSGQAQTCIEAERWLVQELMATRPELRETLRHTLERIVQEQIASLSRAPGGQPLEPEGVCAEAEEPPEGSSDGLRLLTARDVYRELDRFEQANRGDRTHLLRSIHRVRSLLAEHWITLRPLLCGGRADQEPSGADRQYQCCVAMNRRLEQLRRARRKGLEELRRRLTHSLTLLECEMEDWTQGQGDTEACQALLDTCATGLPEQVSPLATGWRRATERYMALQSAYTAEREALFDRDVAPGGRFAEPYSHLIDGSLAAPELASYRAAVTAGAGEAYGRVLDTLAALSDGIGRLRRRIAERGAEQSCERQIAESFDWQFACLRAAVYRSPGWGEAVAALLDESSRISYRHAVQAWREERALSERRRRTYDAYCLADAAYLPKNM